MSLDDVLGQLRDGVQQWETGTAALAGAVAKAEQLSQQFGQLGADGQAQRLAEVRQLLESARAQINLQTPREAEHLIWQATGQQGTATVGDPVSEPRGEVSQPQDESKSRAGRLFRQMGRNASDVHGTVKGSVNKGVDIAKTIDKAFGAPGPTVSSTSADAKPPPSFTQQTPPGTAGDLTTAVVLSAVTIGVGIQAIIDRRHRKRDES